MDNRFRKLYTFQNSQSELDSFLNDYGIEKFIEMPDGAIEHTLKSKEMRSCRFCNKSTPEVTFESEAHIVPDLLGNRFLISDFECDTCNSNFSKHEDNLANFIGLARAISGIKTKKGFPKIANSVTAKWDKLLEAVEVTSKNMVYDQDSTTITCQYKATYIPIRVYKAFLKIALSLINDGDVKAYTAAINFMSSNRGEAHFKNISKLIVYDLPWKVDKPVGVLFRKREIDSKIPSHIFYLYYFNHIYCFPLPFNAIDVITGCYKDFKINVPPILFLNPSDSDTCSSELIDLSLNRKIRKTVKAELTFNNLPTYLKSELEKPGASLTGFRFQHNLPNHSIDNL